MIKTKHNPTRWKRQHDFIAKDYIKKLGITSSARTLPQLPTNILEWIKVARPQVEGRKRSFIVAPFWVPIYQDNHNFKQILGGRQIFKSTYCTDYIAFEATAKQGIQVAYATYDESNLKGFSSQKLQVGTFEQNPLLAQFPRYKLGNIHQISLKNGSVIYMTTDINGYKNLEGKSLDLCVLDEAQYQDIQYVNRVQQTTMATKGKMLILGIGGEAGSPYEKLWNSTNQMEWHYDVPNWRDKLEFDQDGLVIDEYLRDVLKGKWITQNPDGLYSHGYHLPQTIFPTIPLTKLDAVEKYKIHERFSIESQKETMTPSEFISHCLGSFYTSSRRPITRKMVNACMQSALSLMEANEVAELKKKHGDKIKICMGVDFGSGLNSGSTAIAIVIWWKGSDYVQLAWIEKRPAENQLEQAQYIAELFSKHSCDIGVGDLGYGAIQVKQIQEGGYNNKTGKQYAGVGNNRFFGCRTISDETKPLQYFDNKIDEHGEEVGCLRIDKTSSIEFLIETLNKTIHHHDDAGGHSRQKFLIPSANLAEVDFLLNDLISVTRKDLEQISDITLEDGRQQARKLYNHPPDSVMAVIYALTGMQKETKWNWVSTG